MDNRLSFMKPSARKSSSALADEIMRSFDAYDRDFKNPARNSIKKTMTSSLNVTLKPSVNHSSSSSELSESETIDKQSYLSEYDENRESLGKIRHSSSRLVESQNTSVISETPKGRFTGFEMQNPINDSETSGRIGNYGKKF